VINADVEGISELRSKLETANVRITTGLRGACLEAAAAGVEEARGNHPYQDQTYSLTGDAHAEQVEDEAEMVWPVRYASYVDEGTRKNRPYPFTPQAEAKASEVLEREANAVIEAALESLK
jgi:hypothetical protein